MNLTDLPAALVRRLGHLRAHRVARLLRLEAAHAMFCPLCDFEPFDERY